ncbi:MAG: ABC transporter ATP-binding protein [Bacillota bacterium]
MLAIETEKLTRTFQVRGEKKEKRPVAAEDKPPAAAQEEPSAGACASNARGRGRRFWPGGRRSRVVREIRALEGVDLQVREGELFGLLGPNGAGKTTLIKILATLLYPTSGRALVGGHDVVKEPMAVKRLINMVSGGESVGYDVLTVRENLWMFSQFYGIPSREALRRIDALMARLDLAEKASTRINRLSTGQKQKMNFARGFISDPAVIFLDEPTVGLDVNAARTIRGFIREWIAECPGRTVLLTTHYMAEADELCDRVAIIDRGRILACDSPAALKRSLGREVVIRLEVDGQAVADERLAATVAAWPGVRSSRQRVVPGRGVCELTLVLAEDAAIVPVMGRMDEAGIRVRAFRKEEPTLEDVFVSLVGRGLEEETAGEDHARGEP